MFSLRGRTRRGVLLKHRVDLPEGEKQAFPGNTESRELRCGMESRVWSEGALPGFHLGSESSSSPTDKRTLTGLQRDTHGNNIPGVRLARPKLQALQNYTAHSTPL